MSVRAQLLKLTMRLMVRRFWQDGLNLDGLRKGIAFERTAEVFGDCQHEDLLLGGVKVTRISPVATVDDTAIVYLHGGAYVCEAGKLLWTFAVDLVDALGRELYLVDYRVAPEHPFPAAFEDACSAIRAVAQTGRHTTLQLVGDSAGGGLGLAAAMALRGEVALSRMALISPWISLPLANPESVRDEPKDPMLTIAGLREAGRLYAGDSDWNDWRLSPLAGSLENLPPTLVMWGSHEILAADCRQLAAAGEQSGWNLTHHEAAGMFHDWITFAAFPEAVADRQILLDYLRQP